MNMPSEPDSRPGAVPAAPPPGGGASARVALVVQVLLIVALCGLVWWVVQHALDVLRARGVRSGFDFLGDAAGIPISEGRCLAAIGSFHPLSVNDLAMRANLNKAQASRSTQALVDQGMVLKQASEVDGRGVVLTLTPKGQAQWEKVMGVVARRNQEILAGLSAEEQAQLDTLLDRLLQHARKTSLPD